MFDFLISHGANIYVQDKDEDSPYDIASNSGKTEIINYIKSKDFDINHLDKFYNAVNDSSIQSPLRAAVIHNHIDVAQLLLSSGADINYVDRYGYTPLYYAVRLNHTAMAQYLILRGAEIE
ncbi:ankyrin repeat protein, putative [Trichomonas vaginalis G3]|uniref:Ankyrin repeat protein, putative n=1 Tax=Trichomonas vaginalis (strain ATCC PRA-98 / G3) TaxID=412133 RepID=A2DED6_TRIV3|nr:protein ubiquitination [Trichomonas vaginalis G3]EAY21354.1 ankyrin repeat protein, putative [Trichomonas vaginalis G3]KAI5548908.1 protein ubiquitination [Trichomonas vaginalis G3]|eukprot:XP_001582340.1 ankyrin repeat protein [Trichomonas vaginalis G3]